MFGIQLNNISVYKVHYAKPCQNSLIFIQNPFHLDVFKILLVIMSNNSTSCSNTGSMQMDAGMVVGL